MGARASRDAVGAGALTIRAAGGDNHRPPLAFRAGNHGTRHRLAGCPLYDPGHGAALARCRGPD